MDTTQHVPQVVELTRAGFRDLLDWLLEEIGDPTDVCAVIGNATIMQQPTFQVWLTDWYNERMS